MGNLGAYSEIQGVQRKIGRLVSKGVRPIDEATRARFHSYFRLLQRKRAISWAVIASGLAGLITVINVMDKAPDGKEPDWLLPVALVSVLSIAIAGKVQNRHGHWLANGKKMLEREEIELFEGEDGQTIEIFKSSQHLITVNGEHTKSENWIHVDLIADAPDPAPNLDFPSRIQEDSHFGPSRERALTEEELWELKVYQYRHRSPGILPVTSCLTMFGLSMFLIGVCDSDRPFLCIGLSLSLLAAAGWWKLLHELAWNGQVVKDIEGGMVLQFDPSQTLEDPLEILPHSHILWRRGDAPADWRRVRKPVG